MVPLRPPIVLFPQKRRSSNRLDSADDGGRSIGRLVGVHSFEGADHDERGRAAGGKGSIAERVLGAAIGFHQLVFDAPHARLRFAWLAIGRRGREQVDHRKQCIA